MAARSDWEASNTAPISSVNASQLGTAPPGDGVVSHLGFTSESDRGLPTSPSHGPGQRSPNLPIDVHTGQHSTPADLLPAPGVGHLTDQSAARRKDMACPRHGEASSLELRASLSSLVSPAIPGQSCPHPRLVSRRPQPFTVDGLTPPGSA